MLLLEPDGSKSSFITLQKASVLVIELQCVMTAIPVAAMRAYGYAKVLAVVVAAICWLSSTFNAFVASPSFLNCIHAPYGSIIN